jgi:hypothetical protein
MAEALLIINVLNAAIGAGMNATVAIGRVSELVKNRHASGGTLTQEDLKQLFDEGDALENSVRAKIDEALKDADTPK